MLTPLLVVHKPSPWPPRLFLMPKVALSVVYKLEKLEQITMAVRCHHHLSRLIGFLGFGMLRLLSLAWILRICYSPEPR